MAFVVASQLGIQIHQGLQVSTNALKTEQRGVVVRCVLFVCAVCLHGRADMLFAVFRFRFSASASKTKK
jgi:hypothetical protein